MKQRSINKVRSNKTSQKKRYVANQVDNRVTPKLKMVGGYMVWCSKELVNTSAQGTKIPTFIRFVNGTYCRAKHDIVHEDGTVTRYAGRNK